MLSSVLVALLMAGNESEPLLREAGPERLPGVATTCGSLRKDYILEVNGGGVGLGDFDADGDPDLVVVDGSTLERVEGGQPGFPTRLFWNDGGAFEPAGEAWDAGGGRWGMGLATGDVDGDGWLDLLVTEWGPDRLLRNRAGQGFEAVSEAGLAGERWGTSAAFLDGDRDGFLDLVVINYLAFSPREIPSRESGSCRWKGHPVMCGPEGLTPVHDQLYRNRGDGRLEDVSVAAGFRPGRAGFGLGVTTLDFDLDGDTDLYVTNDSTPNHLWENDGGGRFVETGMRRGVALDANGKEQAGMGIGAGDVDGDGRPDLFVTNFSGESNALYLSGTRSGSPRANARWRERAAPAGVGGPSVRRLGWGAITADLDLDGLLDLAVFNGHVYPEADRAGTDSSYAQADVLHLGRGAGRFAAALLSDAPASVSRASTAGDLDSDGDLDLVALDLDGPVRVLDNRARQEHPERHWLAVALAGRGANRAGIGARIELVWEGGRALREVRTAGGYQAALPAVAHFGLGPVERLERLEVHWPSGRRSRLEDVAVDRRLVVTEPEAQDAGEGERGESER